MRDQMAALGVRMMPPFSDMPHLYQELTLGDWAAVDPARVDALGFNKPGIDGVLQKLDPRRYGKLKAEQAVAG